jgi:hypothetical protein
MYMYYIQMNIHNLGKYLQKDRELNVIILLSSAINTEICIALQDKKLTSLQYL